MNGGVLKLNSDGTANTIGVLTNAVLNTYQTVAEVSGGVLKLNSDGTTIILQTIQVPSSKVDNLYFPR